MQKQADIIGPLLTLQNWPDRGLQIRWNFTGIMHNSNFQTYHIFITIGNEIDVARKFIQLYYDNLKFGDLIGVYRVGDGYGDGGGIKWAEKTVFQLGKSFFKEKHLWRQFGQKQLSTFITNATKHKGLLITNILIPPHPTHPHPHPQPHKILKSLIHQLRTSSPEADSLLFNLITTPSPSTALLLGLGTNQTPKLIDCSLGVNQFFYDQGNPEATVLEIRNYLRLVVARSLKVRIVVGNGVFCKLANKMQWRILDNSQFQKSYHFPPMCKLDQYLVFLVRQQNSELTLNLQIHLTLQFHTGQQIRARKTCSFATNSNYFKSKTTFDGDQEFGVTDAGNCCFVSNMIRKVCYFWVFHV